MEFVRSTLESDSVINDRRQEKQSYLSAMEVIIYTSKQPHTWHFVAVSVIPYSVCAWGYNSNMHTQKLPISYDNSETND